MRLGAYLQKHGITQREFADRVGCEQPTITRFIAGRIPSSDLMRKIAEETGGQVAPNDFFDLPEPTPQGRAA